jgi:hypothetical protein
LDLVEPTGRGREPIAVQFTGRFCDRQAVAVFVVGVTQAVVD